MFLAETDSNANHSVDDTRCECDATNGDTTIAVGTEDRFRVDRRKLERLLQVDGSEDNAETFFAKVMKETNTVIAWPSKLKIGAKSKKDPHIKVTGEKQAVSDAKERILNILNTRVSIAGSCVGVEEARQKIRSLQPLVFMFDLPTMPADGTHTAVIQRIQQLYEVSVMIKPQPRTNSTRPISPCTVVIRGSVQNAKAVKEAAVALHDHFTGQVGVPFFVTSALDVAPQHHPVILGPSNTNLRQIMLRSGATIHFPVGDQQQQLRGTFYITGSPASVCLARHLLLGCIPMTLMFDVDEDVNVNQDQVTQLMEQLGVFISIRPKPKQPAKSVIIKCVERNIVNTYEVWKLLSAPDFSVLRGNPSTGVDVSTHSSTRVAAKAFSPDLFSNSTTCYNRSSPQLLQQSAYIPLHAAYPVTPVFIQSKNELLMRPSVPISLSRGVPGSFVVQNMENAGTMPSGAIKLQTQTLSEQGVGSDVTHINYNEVSQLKLSPVSQENLASKLVSKLQPETVQSLIRSDQSHQSIDLIAQMLNAIGSGSSNNSSDPIQTNVEQCHSPALSMFVSRLDDKHVVSDPWQSSKSPTESSNCSKESILSDQNKAPGSNRPRKAINSSFYRETSESADFDYEQMRVKANRAVRSKPVGESRVPNDSWFGCGFSKSMPDADMRMRLSNNIVRGYRQPDLSNAFEAQENPWKSISNSGAEYNDTSSSIINHNASIHSHSGVELSCDSLNDDINLPGLPTDRHHSNADMTTRLVSDSSIWSSLSERRIDPVGVTGKEALIGAKELWDDDEEDLAELFGRLGLGKYTDLFQHQEIDMSTFLTLNDNDLKELGITTFGARRRMLNAIASLNKRQSLQLNMCIGPPDIFTSRNIAQRTQRHDNIASQSGRW